MPAINRSKLQTAVLLTMLEVCIFTPALSYVMDENKQPPSLSQELQIERSQTEISGWGVRYSSKKEIIHKVIK